jgi:hypothetical protein
LQIQWTLFAQAATGQAQPGAFFAQQGQSAPVC